MRVTIKDIAIRSNLSHTTVSRVLNRRGDAFISEQTRQRILTLAREMGYQPNTIARALVTGRSNTIALAISAVAARAWPAGTQVRVVVVLDLRFWVEMASYGAPGWQVGEGIYDDKSWARKAVSAVTRELSEAGLLATAVIQEGNPKHVLIRESESFSADCIFVGAKGHSRIERLLIGSVSMAVAANAPCSVEVVRQG